MCYHNIQNKGVVGARRGAVNILGAWPSGRVLNDETYLSVGDRWVFFLLPKCRCCL